ncbi:hypothetical protein Tco_1157440 [Tanacetum coccineum]
MHMIKEDIILGRLKFVAKNEDNQVYGKTILDNMVSKEIKESTAYKTYFAYATDYFDPDPAKNPTGRRKPTSVIIKDTHDVSKKKSAVQTQKHKGMEMLSDVALIEEAQTKKAIKKSVQETCFKHHTGGSSDGAGSQPDVPDESKGNKDEDDDDKSIDLNKTESNDERTESNDDKSVDLNKTNNEEETQKDEFELYGDVNVEMKDVEPAMKAKETITSTLATQKENTNVPPSSSSRSVSSNYVPTAVKEYLGTNLGDAIHKIEHVAKQQESHYTIKSSNKVALNEFDQNQALFETLTASKSFNNHPKQMALYHALMESILADEEAMDQGPKSTGKFGQVEETVFEAADTDIPHNQGDDIGEHPNVEGALKKDWFKKPERPPTHDPEWNQGKSIDDEPTHNWLNDHIKANKPPLTFNELMNTLIDLSAYVMS